MEAKPRPHPAGHRPWQLLQEEAVPQALLVWPEDSGTTLSLPLTRPGAAVCCHPGPALRQREQLSLVDALQLQQLYEVHPAATV